MVKYADRGLANDRYYYNMNWTLFKVLFWIANICTFALNQGMMWSFSLKHGKDLAENSHRQAQYISRIYITFNM